MSRLVAYHGYEGGIYMGCFIAVATRRHPALSEALMRTYAVCGAQSFDEFRYHDVEHQPRFDADDVEVTDTVFARIAARLGMHDCLGQSQGMAAPR